MKSRKDEQSFSPVRGCLSKYFYTNLQLQTLTYSSIWIIIQNHFVKGTADRPLVVRVAGDHAFSRVGGWARGGCREGLLPRSAKAPGNGRTYVSAR